ncbi:parathyroid hormone-related protein [Protopterus annectens]|uniref:parathyroid hormone-related protein n=1 Tax=Protopterus annectens TaxID=7888 RepID=UPI001CF9BCDB|nr:parathyroid hormone-related protein [Protopterus annectens]XP_043944130.1 parathyroid hormone-related protein [Protopterus annectens]
MVLNLCRQWSFALLFLCCSVLSDGRHVNAISNRVKRAVAEHQLLHDKARSLQDQRRRIYLQNLIEGVNTAEIRSLSDVILNTKPSSSVKSHSAPLSNKSGARHMTQETNKFQIYKQQSLKLSGKKKKGKAGVWKDQEKKKRRPRSIRTDLRKFSSTAFLTLHPSINQLWN